MRDCCIAGVLLWALAVASARGQSSPPADNLLLQGRQASTWTEGETSIVQLDGPVSIDIDKTHLGAQHAVVWLTPATGGVTGQQQAQIALLGEASLHVPDLQVTRSGDRLYVSVIVKGEIRITAEKRTAKNLGDSPVYLAAQALLPPGDSPVKRLRPEQVTQRPWQPTTPPPTTLPTTRPGQRPPARMPVNFKAEHVQTVQTSENRVAMVLSGGVLLVQHRDTGDLIELQADRVVLFTELHSLRDLEKSEKFKRVDDAVEAAYLEGDVRILYTPAGRNRAEQRLAANRVYYEFGTDRAILTDAVIHTYEPQRQIPAIIRAQTLRQLSLGEFNARNVQLSSSAFATPSYSVAMSKAYVRQVENPGDYRGTITRFTGDDLTIRAFNVPFFYLPQAGGTITDRGFPLRSMEFDSTSRSGSGPVMEFGLFETLGLIPPSGVDASYLLGYLSDRGPLVGLNGNYQGGFVTETTHEPWTFAGRVQSIFVDDEGTDEFGGSRQIVNPQTNMRGSALWEHQHFFPDDWQVQIRAGWVSDPTFLEEWRTNQFYSDQPHDVSFYVKHQQDTEALTFLYQFQPNNFVTTSDLLQEQFEVEHVPEITYHRIGDSLLDDRLTLFSDNSLSGLRFNPSSASLADLGFGPGLSPGLPSLGMTGTPTDTTYRGDLRQEIDYPLNLGKFKAVPYVMGRYTGYTNSPTGSDVNRLLLGTGVRVTTAFWKVDDSAYSELFDIHRLRHVIEPEVNVFTSTQSEDQADVLIYDEGIDRTSAITAVQLALRQRWQTKRGGPGQWRSVDFLTLNTEFNFFTDQPSDAELNPTAFRGLYFTTLPEASVPRNSINADATWRISDTTALLSDCQYNMDTQNLATASIGFAAQHGERLTYFVGTRYIELLGSNIASVVASYQLTSKYTISVAESFDMFVDQEVVMPLRLTRRFDRFYASFTLYNDNVTGETGFRVVVMPMELARGTAESLNNVFSGR